MPDCTPGHADQCASSVSAKCECRCGGVNHGSLSIHVEPGPGKSDGYVYLLHFEPAYRTARHYLGFTSGAVGDRIRRHIEGKGSPLVAAASAAGSAIYLGRTWRGGRDLEAALKRRKNAAKLCLVCQGRR